MYLDAGLLDINGTFWIETAAFVLMILVLGRYVYPRVMEAAESRQKQISKQLDDAEKARQEAEARLIEAKAQLDQARTQAQDIIVGAGKSGELLRAELRQKADEEAKRVVEKARVDIEAERQKAIDSVRGEVANLVVEATSKVIGESLDGERHRKLIDRAIKEVASGERQR